MYRTRAFGLAATTVNRFGVALWILVILGIIYLTILIVRALK